MVVVGWKGNLNDYCGKKMEVVKAVKMYCRRGSRTGKYCHTLWDYQYSFYIRETTYIIL